MNPDMSLLLLMAGFAAAGWAATRLVLRMLTRRRILDHPNERSSHDRPTPRGGGIAVVGVALLAAAGFGVPWTIIAAALALACLSWVDDLRGLPASLRLAGQVAAVWLGVQALPAGEPVLQNLFPPAFDRILAMLVWVWFINLFNFMDGIDGLAGIETAAIGGGAAALALLAIASPLEPAAAGLGVALCGAALGFLVFNWHPARIFLGDVGSVPIGFLLGWLLLSLAAAGAWEAALLLPLYHLADAGLTLARRFLAGEKVWQAHRSHFYQRAARGLAGRHDKVAALVAALNLALAGLAGATLMLPSPPGSALAAGGALTAALLWYFSRLEPAAESAAGGGEDR